MRPDSGAPSVLVPDHLRANVPSPHRRRPALITGAGGQMGRALGSLLPDALLLTRSDLDVTDAPAAREAIGRARPSVVIHTAAWTAVDAAERDPEGARRVNVGATRALAEAAGASDALFVYLSTDYVFAGHARRPYRETDRPAPLSVYGMTKLQGEEAARGCEWHLIVRTSWLFGEGRNFVRSILSAARDRPDLPVVSDQVGLPTYAPYLAEGILQLIDSGALGTFHLAGSGDPCSWADLAKATLEAAGAASRLPSMPSVRPVTTAEYARAAPRPPAPRPAFSVLDCSKAKDQGVTLRPWREGLHEYIERLPDDLLDPSHGGEGAR